MPILSGTVASLAEDFGPWNSSPLSDIQPDLP